MLSHKKHLKSYRYAFKGLKIVCRENNFKIHIIMAVSVLLLSYWLEISQTHWIVIIICISLVLTAEVFNTAIERLCDHLHPDQHEAIANVKDLSALAVLVSAIAAAIVGSIIFCEYLPLDSLFY